MNFCFTLFCVVLSLFYCQVVSQTCSNTEPCAFTGGSNLTQPQQLVSSGGTLTINLVADVSNVTIEWLSLFRRTFNGMIPAPTWRIKPGDVVTVTVTNNLKTPQKEQALNDLRLPNSTNIHVHGLHISSQTPQDNVFIHISPEGSNTYVYQIGADQPAGTYWYHPHLHGSTMFQVASGMAGMIVVDDPTSGTYAAPAHLAAVSCPDNCQHDIQLVFQPVLLYSGNNGFGNLQTRIEDDALFQNPETTSGGITLQQYLAQNVNLFTTNGQVQPMIEVVAGQTKRFRMVNAGGNPTLEIGIYDSATQTPACTYMEIAIDGVYLNEARTPRLDKSFFVPSAKIDWLVVCNTPGTYELRSMPDNADESSIGRFDRYTGLLLTIVVTGTAASTVLETSLPPRQSFINDFQNLTQDEVNGRFVIEAAPGTQLNRERFSSETDYRFQAHVNTVQEWYLTNADPNAGHPIHIHVNHFQVISYNDYTGPIAVNAMGTNFFFSQAREQCEINPTTFQGNTQMLAALNTAIPNHRQMWLDGGAGSLGYAQAGEFRDVLLVPPLSNITIRFMTHEFTGEVVMHCHILNHEDTGMMMTTDIVNQGAEIDMTLASSTSYGYPGQCARCDPFPFNSVNTSECTATVAVVATSTSPDLMHSKSQLCLICIFAAMLVNIFENCWF